MYHESTEHAQNSFITLTYRDPAPEKLNKKHVQNFIGRMAHKYKFRYFLCGEYGETTKRPHYHMALFGHDFLGGSYSINEQLYGNKILDSYWKHGNTVISEFNMSTACYIAGYVDKKLSDPDSFTTMSKRPPIGWSWAHRNQENMQRLEKVIIEGQEFRIPRLYLQWGEATNYRPGVIDLDEAKANRTKEVRNYWLQELKAKEINHASRDAQKKGETL